MSDEHHYQAAIQEFDSGKADEALLAKAWVNADGDDARKKLEYVKLRVAQLKSARVRQVVSAAGDAATIAGPSMMRLVFHFAKLVVWLVLIAVGVSELSHRTGEVNTGNTVGVVLAGVLVIYVTSKALDWVLFKRIFDNRIQMVAASAGTSFLLILALWIFGKGAAGTVHPHMLEHFFFAWVIVFLARTPYIGRG